MGTMPEDGARGTTRKKMSMLRRKVAERLLAVKSETAMLTTFNEVNMQPIFDLRAQYKEDFKAEARSRSRIYVFLYISRCKSFKNVSRRELND